MKKSRKSQQKSIKSAKKSKFVNIFFAKKFDIIDT